MIQVNFAGSQVFKAFRIYKGSQRAPVDLVVYALLGHVDSKNRTRKAATMSRVSMSAITVYFRKLLCSAMSETEKFSWTAQLFCLTS